MTDTDPRLALEMQRDDDTAAELLDSLMDKADRYALVAFTAQSFERAQRHDARARLESAIRAALQKQ